MTSGVGISSLFSGIWSHSIRTGRSSCSLPSADSIVKPFARIPVVVTFPEHVNIVYSSGSFWIPNIRKNSVEAKERLLWSSMMAYVCTDIPLMSLWNTFTGNIFAHDLPLNPFLQISVQLELTDAVTIGLAVCLGSPPSFDVGFSGGVAVSWRPTLFKCNAVGWDWLLHSLQLTFFVHSLLLCDVEAQHLKQMLCFTSNALRSSSDFLRKAKHSLSLCLPLWRMHPSCGILLFSNFWSTPVLCTPICPFG